MVRSWMEAGIRDSKTIIDGAILKMAKHIASTKGGHQDRLYGHVK